MKKKDLLKRIEELERKIKEIEGVKPNPFEITPLPPVLPPYTDKDMPWNHPNPFPPLPNNMICCHCGNDSGWAKVLCMVIPPDGLRCMSCGRICIYGSTVTCETYTHTHPLYNIETKPIPPNTVVCGCEGCGGYHGCEEPFPSDERLPN